MEVCKMTERLYYAYDVDECTPVQFVGVYVTRWHPEWGQPTVMFAEIEWTDQILKDAADDLLAACKELVRAENEADDEANFQRLVTATEMARAAIARVEGR
jgi:hypothetical protein